MQLIRQNKKFIFIVIFLFIFSASAIYFGGNRLLESELKSHHEHITAELNSATELVEVYYSDFQNDLFFLRDCPCINNYIESDYSDASYRDTAKDVFQSFARTHRDYYQIRIIDTSGHERVRIDNKHDSTTLIVPDPELQNKKNRYYFQEAIKLDEGQMYASPIDLNIEQGKVEVPHTPVIRIATTLFNSKGEKKGILILNIYFSKVLETLPINSFIQTENGNLVSLIEDGTVDFRKSDYNFPDGNSELCTSDTESIHYSDAELFPGKKLTVALYDTHSLLKATEQKLILMSLGLLAVIFVLILIITRLNFSRFRELVGAQKAIIYSLAGLAEWRDPETGGHLQRTRTYVVALAKQLRKNKKYRKVITSDFIESLFDACPLHDIGKVGIRDNILLKEASLTDEEYEAMKKHVQIGKQLLQNVLDNFNLKDSFLGVGKNICEYHHEKYNGKGYTEGIKGVDIPLEARIFMLCDAYDTIISKRPYKEPFSHEEAVRRIKLDRGEHFDPDIVDAFLECEKEFLEISNSYSS